jgi:predicted RND superfamily exporter protein
MLFEKYYKNRVKILIGTVIVSLLSIVSFPNLKFAFNFEQFFPTGDEDLEFFQDFIEEFETDDNFLLIALENEPSIFDISFLKEVKSFAEACERIDYVKTVQSLPQIKYPTLNPLGVPGFRTIVDLNDPEQLALDGSRLMQDERIVYNLINEEATATIVLLKTEDGIQLEESKTIMKAVDAALSNYKFDDYHILGRAYFQTELSNLQFREILISTIVSGFLISIIMVLIFRRWRSILIALSSIALALLLFLGLLSILGRELSLMAALYPILMLIVGTSDVIHIMTKYMDEILRGNTRKHALEITIRQIGLATLLTSLTTAVGFATLLSSRIIPIREFGVNSAIGVLVAYLVMIFFTCPLMSLFDKNQLVKKSDSKISWDNFLSWCYFKSLNKGPYIAAGFAIFAVLSTIGISKIHTNYELEKNLPRGAKITEDFNFFEKEFAGFRPLELAVYLKPGHEIYDYEVIHAIAKAENYIRSKEEIQTSLSLATLARSINQMLKFNRPDAYVMPDSSAYGPVREFMKNLDMMGSEALISKDQRKSRVSAKIKDVGAENIKQLSADIDKWIASNIDSSVVSMKQTGTGLILDKNSEFVRQSLLYGLGFAILIVSILMGFLFKKIRYLFIAIIPNVVPLVFAAALIGFGDIPLEAGTSIIFAIIFGIAVDDTIHFMSKYKLAYDKYKDVEKAMYITFTETGKAIVYTSIILFFGFLVLLFSSTMPSVIIGLLISITLISAVIADLLLLPVIIRRFDKPMINN